MFFLKYILYMLKDVIIPDFIFYLQKNHSENDENTPNASSIK